MCGLREVQWERARIGRLEREVVHLHGAGANVLFRECHADCGGEPGCGIIEHIGGALLGLANSDSIVHGDTDVKCDSIGDGEFVCVWNCDAISVCKCIGKCDRVVNGDDNSVY